MPLYEADRSIQGVNVHYIDAGSPSANPILLLHGGVGNARFHWERLVTELAPDFHVVAPDLPGFGKSDLLPQMNYAALLTWTSNLLDALDLSQTVLVGNSMGGLIARLYAAANPIRVPALVLINGGRLTSTAALPVRWLTNFPVAGRLFLNNVSRQGVKSRESLGWLTAKAADTNILTDEMVQTAQANLPGMSALLKMQLNSPLPDPRIPSLPTLIMWGEDDTLLPLTIGEGIRDAIPGAKWIPISGTRHTPHLDEPDVIAFQISKFLENMVRNR
ncbi:MAG: alpha/beta fold hydrolase [Phototrophicaceae bacterium]|jgi:4,5:9,10-diseco-3-hydroxy-5,9,17-trioxoandrosta-1(10),2-diene-4-oate hydrolase